MTAPAHPQRCSICKTEMILSKFTKNYYCPYHGEFDKEEMRPQHCDHECVCWWYYDHKKSGSAAPCESTKCHHRMWIDDSCASHSSAQSRDRVLDELYPPNTRIERNGDLYGNWEIEPKSLKRLKDYIRSNPQYEEEPDMEVIEVVIRAIKHELKYGKAELRSTQGSRDP